MCSNSRRGSVACRRAPRQSAPGAPSPVAMNGEVPGGEVRSPGGLRRRKARLSEAVVFRLPRFNLGVKAKGRNVSDPFSP